MAAHGFVFLLNMKHVVLRDATEGFQHFSALFRNHAILLQSLNDRRQVADLLS